MRIRKEDMNPTELSSLFQEKRKRMQIKRALRMEDMEHERKGSGNHFNILFLITIFIPPSSSCSPAENF